MNTNAKVIISILVVLVLVMVGVVVKQSQINPADDNVNMLRYTPNPVEAFDLTSWEVQTASVGEAKYIISDSGEQEFNACNQPQEVVYSCTGQVYGEYGYGVKLNLEIGAEQTVTVIAGLSPQITTLVGESRAKTVTRSWVVPAGEIHTLRVTYLDLVQEGAGVAYNYVDDITLNGNFTHFTGSCAIEIELVKTEACMGAPDQGEILPNQNTNPAPRPDPQPITNDSTTADSNTDSTSLYTGNGFEVLMKNESVNPVRMAGVGNEQTCTLPAGCNVIGDPGVIGTLNENDTNPSAVYINSETQMNLAGNEALLKLPAYGYTMISAAILNLEVDTVELHLRQSSIREWFVIIKGVSTNSDMLITDYVPLSTLVTLFPVAQADGGFFSQVYLQQNVDNSHQNNCSGGCEHVSVVIIDPNDGSWSIIDHTKATGWSLVATNIAS